jgi:hypothetical protein
MIKSVFSFLITPSFSQRLCALHMWLNLYIPYSHLYNILFLNIMKYNEYLTGTGSLTDCLPEISTSNVFKG